MNYHFIIALLSSLFTMLFIFVKGQEEIGDYSGRIDYIDEQNNRLIKQIQMEIQTLKQERSADSQKLADLVEENRRLKETVNEISRFNESFQQKFDEFSKSLNAHVQDHQNYNLTDIKIKMIELESQLHLLTEVSRVQKQIQIRQSKLDRRLAALKDEVQAIKTSQSKSWSSIVSGIVHQNKKLEQLQNVTDLLQIQLIDGESTKNTQYYTIFTKSRTNNNDDRKSSDPKIVQQMSTNVLKIYQLLDDIDKNVSLLFDKYTWYSFVVEHFNTEINVIKEELYKIMHLFYDTDNRVPNITNFLDTEYQEIGAPLVYNIEEGAKRTRNLRIEMNEIRLKANDASSTVRQLAEKVEHLATKQEKCDQRTKLESQEVTSKFQMLQNSLFNLTNLMETLENFQTASLENLQMDVQNAMKNLTENSLKVDKVWTLSENIKRHQSSHFSSIQNLRQRNFDLDTQLNSLSLKFAQLQAEFLNSTLNVVKGSNTDLYQDARLADFRSDVEKLTSKIGGVQDTLKSTLISLRQKADYQDMKKIMADIDSFTDKLQSLSKLNETFDETRQSIQNLESQLPVDCSFSNVPFKYMIYQSGVYLIKSMSASQCFKVWCTMDSGVDERWTVIQRRGETDMGFNKTWLQYKNGFGDITSDYWLGNQRIHELTSQATYQLRVDVWDIFDDHYYALYDNFSTKSVESSFELQIGGHNGNLSDALSSHNGAKFSSQDLDNDASSTHCAKFYESGWWFTHCHAANLNGRYGVGIIWFNNQTQNWMQLKKTIMKIRPWNKTV